MKRIEAKDRMKNVLLFIPNFIAMLGRMMVDSRVPLTEKLLVAGSIAYAVSPIDFIPDFLPFVGQVDDAYLIALTILRMINHTDENVVRSHWNGGGDVIQLTQTIANLAPRLLPARVKGVLSERVEMHGAKVKRVSATPAAK